MGTWEKVAIAAGISIASALVSLAVVTIVLVRIPPDYFVDPKHRTTHARHPAARIALLILKNLLGILVVIGGLAMSLPGVPGQGLLTIFLGIMLLNFPGKYRVERAILRRPSILNAINRIRGRFGKPALQVP
jgi:hypothetical protein